MSKESFNWKRLFVNETEQDSSNEISKSNATPPPSSFNLNKFPEETNNKSKANLTNPFLNEILEVYQKGFESLNLSDFDFFEMYKSVVAVGITNPQSYQMAFAMGKSIKKDLTKDYLLEKSKFYIEEINKVYTQYDKTGNEKKQSLIDLVISEKQSLASSINDLESKILQLQKELHEQKLLLSNIDSKNENKLGELQLKIEANNFAKKEILDSINLVISGINQYL